MTYEPVAVFRDADGIDCSNGGITARNARVYLFDGDRNECIAFAKEKGWENKSLWLNRRMLWGERHYFAEPLIMPENMAQTFGGNFVYTSDGCFLRMCGTSTCQPLPVHDRFDTWANFDALTR